MNTQDPQLKPSDWVRPFQNTTRPPEPAIDKAVSEIVGKPIRINNPQLIKLVVKYKQMKGDDSSQDNFLENEDFIKELKEMFK